MRMSFVEERAPEYAEHQDLSYILDASGTKRPIKTVRDWEERRRHIAYWMQTVMGPLPKPETPAPPGVQFLEAERVGTLVRRRIAYHTDSPERVVQAYLFLPEAAFAKEAGKLPAILCLHQTTA